VDSNKARMIVSGAVDETLREQCCLAQYLSFCDDGQDGAAGKPASVGAVVHSIDAVERRFSDRTEQGRASTTLHALDEILEERVASSRGRQVPRGVKRKMSGHPLRPRTPQPKAWIDVAAANRLAK